jgi:hypothetical protein
MNRKRAGKVQCLTLTCCMAASSAAAEPKSSQLCRPLTQNSRPRVKLIDLVFRFGLAIYR